MNSFRIMRVLIKVLYLYAREGKGFSLVPSMNPIEKHFKISSKSVN